MSFICSCVCYLYLHNSFLLLFTILYKGAESLICISIINIYLTLHEFLLKISFPGCSGAQLRSTGGAALVPNRRITGFRREIRRTEGPCRPGRVHVLYVTSYIT